MHGKNSEHNSDNINKVYKKNLKLKINTKTTHIEFSQLTTIR